jgi:ABC-2 type transport system ATP-binding protein
MLVKGPLEWLQKSRMKDHIVGLQQRSFGFEGLIAKAHYSEDRFRHPVTIEKPSLDDILVYTKEGN